VIGLAWWALGFPFMKRYSKAYLEKHPEKKGKDLETTRKTCAKFQNNSVGIFNFVEGTRFTEGKHAQQKSPFKHLLKPKAGGIAFVLDAMGEQLESIVNVTIHYPAGRPGYWDLLCGKVKDVVVNFEEVPIAPQFIGKNYDQDAEYRLEFQQWINVLWENKDALLAQMHREYPDHR
jgi:1-acyl-sn-glycerol-3-phosphate acyltransferase